MSDLVGTLRLDLGDGRGMKFDITTKMADGVTIGRRTMTVAVDVGFWIIGRGV